MTRQFVITSEKTAPEVIGDITDEVRLWNRDAASEVITAWDVIPPTKIGETAAHLRVELRNQAVEFKCHSQPTYALNLKACHLALEAMRLNEKRGIGDVMREAYAMLSAPTRQRDPYEVLGVRSDAELEDIEAVYRSKAKRAHPDAGGSNEAMKELNDAMERIKADRR